MSADAGYGQNTKRIVFTENDHRHAQLVLKLKYHQLSQAAFFRHIISGVIEEDPRIMEYLGDISFKSKDRRARSDKLHKTGVQKMRDLGLSDSDVEGIFDLIEESGPEL
tara:strand:+ start:527 stop:853 length:327 start_codon:yes stop_codon:yes gene_type:complete